MDQEERKLKIQILLYASIFIVALKLLDWLVFEKWYFSFPNELEWDTSPWYNFLHLVHSIPKEPDPGKVLIAGSSIALYSVLPEKFKNLNPPPKSQMQFPEIQPYFFSHVAMAPTDLYYYLDKVVSLNPAIVMYILNPADFQMEFLEVKDGKATYNYKEWVRQFSWRYPVRLIYPFSFSLDYFLDLNKNEIFRLWSKSFLYANRYREFLWDPFLAYQERHFRSGRSYHVYTGSMPYEGIWQHGWTRTHFTIPCDMEIRDKALYRKDSIYVPQPETQVHVKSKGKRIQEWNFQKPGWYSVEIHIPEQNTTPSNKDPDNYQKVTVDLEWDINQSYSSRLAENRPYGKDYPYGIRLSQNFCKMELERNISYTRKEFLEDHRFESMSLAEYEKDYFERIYKDADIRPELSRFVALSKAKLILNNQEFFQWIELERISAIRKKLESHGIRFIVIFSPENPLELQKYSQGEWYLNLLDYLGESSNGHFYDFSKFFKDPRYFSDPHHLTYSGALLFTEALQEVLIQEFGNEE